MLTTLLQLQVAWHQKPVDTQLIQILAVAHSVAFKCYPALCVDGDDDGDVDVDDNEGDAEIVLCTQFTAVNEMDGDVNAESQIVILSFSGSTVISL